MKRLLLPFCLLMACGPKEDTTGLLRKPVTHSTQNGWARLRLDSEAQRAFPNVWLGDAQGTSIPFVTEKDGLWSSVQLETDKVLLGRTAKGEASVEFSLKLPTGWELREREQLQIDLELEGPVPYVCRVEVERKLPEGKFLGLEQASPSHVYALARSGQRTDFLIPWDAREYRLRLISTQGSSPSIRGLKVTALTRPEALSELEVVAPSQSQRSEKEGFETWSYTFAASERFVAADVRLKAPVAPIPIELRVPNDSKEMEPSTGSLYPQGLVWNLPALNTTSTRITFGPTQTPRLELALPKGVQLESATFLACREVLIFPAEAGKATFLHLGGALKPAPGNLALLPASSRALYAQQALSLGASEPDPQGIPKTIGRSERTRPWLPWIAGLAVLAMGSAAWKLLKSA
jgi:hypothetical protein